MAYSLAEIAVINQEGLAEEGLYYYTDDGLVYKGTSQGRLISIDPDLIDLQDSVQKLSTEVAAISGAVDDIVTEPEPEPITSYFEVDTGFGFLVPVDPITNIIAGNIFILDTDIGALIPNTYDSFNTDEHFEYEGAGDCIIPKAA